MGVGVWDFFKKVDTKVKSLISVVNCDGIINDIEVLTKAPKSDKSQNLDLEGV